MKVREKVALLSCDSYEKEGLKVHIDTLCHALGFSVRSGESVLLKPNLVAASVHNGWAVTDPEFVAAVAAWCIDCGARVSIGDSPAFGSAIHVMEKSGYHKALKGLPVQLINFQKKKPIKTKNGFHPVIASEIAEYDYLLNLPKVKAHCQLRLTMAVKNFFGVVLSWRKAFAHMQHGNKHFVKMVVDLLDVVPAGISIVDGISAMHKRGPVDGELFRLSLIAASRNPVALDTALMKILGVDSAVSPLWQECQARGMSGCYDNELLFPLAQPSELAVQGFEIPEKLSPIRFQVHSFIINSIKKLFS